MYFLSRIDSSVLITSICCFKERNDESSHCSTGGEDLPGKYLSVRGIKVSWKIIWCSRTR